MTKIWLISDLHEETSAFQLPPTPADAEVLVVAGDVSEDAGRSLLACAHWQVRTRLPLIFVPGNHDYYGRDLDTWHAHQDVLDSFAQAGLHVLHSGQSVVIGGTRFIGATLWTDFAIAGDVLKAGHWAMEHMPDHRSIDMGALRVRARDLWHEHRKQLAAIQNVLKQPFDGPTVVVTHHAPHPNSLSDPDLIDESDASFASDLSGTMELWRPAAWLHGHVHSSHDYVVGSTRVVCNPRGYVMPHGKENAAFNRRLVIDVS